MGREADAVMKLITRGFIWRHTTRNELVYLIIDSETAFDLHENKIARLVPKNGTKDWRLEITWIDSDYVRIA